MTVKTDKIEGQPDTQGKDLDNTVPYDRFQQVVATKNEMGAKITDLESQVQSLTEKAATVDTLGTQIQEWKAKAEAAEGKYGRWQTIAATLGTTDQEAIEAAEWAHSRLPEADRPEIDVWLGGIKEKPEDAPKVLHPWLVSEAQGQDQDKKDPAQKPKNPHKQTRQPGTQSAVAPEAVREARQYAVRTGDWSKYKDLVKASGMKTNVT